MKLPRGGKSRRKFARSFIVNSITFILTPTEELISHATLREGAPIFNVSPLKDLRNSLPRNKETYLNRGIKDKYTNM